MNRLKYILQHRYYIKILTVLVVILSYLYTTNIEKQSIYQNESEFTGKIYKLISNENTTTIYIKAKEKLIIKYYAQIKDIYLGDTIKITGKLSKPASNTVPNTFNYKDYLYNEDIYNIIIANNILKVKNNTNIIYDIKNRINKRLKNIDNANEYLSIFILGNKSGLSKEVMESYHNNGISHLFSISGMHISLFASIILCLLKKISYNNYYNYSIVILFLLLYSLLIGSTPSVIRSLMMYILFTINKLFNLKINSLNIMLLLLITILFINPYFIYNTSFQFSYIVSFTLITNKKRIKRYKHKLTKSLYISFLSFLVSMPICIYNYYQINVLSILLNIFFIPFVSLLIFPLALICFIIPKLTIILNSLIKFMELFSISISNSHIGIISFSKPSILIILIYYLFISLFINNHKYFLLIALIITHKMSPYFNSSIICTYLDVNQGDSTLIKLAHNKGNILIDTGGIATNNYELTKNKTIPYLKSLGITSLTYVIITHGDYDHMGEAINLVNNFKVEKVIFNCGNYNDLEKELIKVLEKKKIKYYSCIKELNINKNKLYFLQTRVYDNENDNSNVIYTELGGYKFMFMGDAGVEKEKDILDKYNISDIDVLKVGHHGSKTSSSIEFINEINPKYSIISVGKNNRYGHPNKEVLDNLKESKIYRTDQDGSIMFKIKTNKLKIDTCSP